MRIKSAVTYDIRTPVFDIDRVVSELAAVRHQWREGRQRSTEPGGRELPSREAVAEIMAGLCGALFPMRLGPVELRQESEDFYVGHTLDLALHSLYTQVRLELMYVARYEGKERENIDQQALQIVRSFSRTLPDIRSLLDSDVIAAYQGDPAARSVDEVLLCYPGILALIHHRIAHCLYQLGVPLLARIAAELAHAQTGIDIHPGASIGTGFFIDHGTGVVIGETAIIGANVRIYQAVTLGAKRFPADADGTLQKGLPRHPVVEDEVVIYAGATVLGRVTIGRGAVIGGNVWITQDVPAGSHVTQAGSLQQGRTVQP
ncbi:serine O-acetyltransferase EpsC [Undibacterium sp. Ji67W]|uniref:serine O-acetyltransferase EpsC n=1 Tax=Undibacterium sp. Ji67W TaxID=3413042 RepID=UPI003BF21ECE